MKYVALLGRVLFALIFVRYSFGLFSKDPAGYAAGHGVPLASILVPIAGILALLGGLSVASGYKARWGAWFLVAFLVPVTLMMHNFWTVKDPMEASMQEGMFLKNLSMLGGAFLVAYFGAGPASVDSWLEGRSSQGRQ